MLTKEHAIVTYEKGKAVPDRLWRRPHRQYLGYADAMLKIYREGIGRTRQEIHRDIRSILEGERDCPSKRIEAFCKLLDDESEYAMDAAGGAAKLRQKVYRAAARCHPLVTQRDKLFEYTEKAIKEKIAAELRLNWEDIQKRLFADVIELHRLQCPPTYPEAQALLSRYNVAQIQAALYRAAKMTIWAKQDFKQILRHVKMSNLLHTICLEANGRYKIEIDGPASVLRETRRYGVSMARMIPALLACKGWQLRADIQCNRGGWMPRLELSSEDGLKSHLGSPEPFDSELEARFMKKWGDGPREGWRLLREGEVLHKHQKVFVPDFTLRHDDGRSVSLEIVGFWTPEYLSHKLETLKLFPERRILLAIAKSSASQMNLPQDAFIFKSSIKVKDVLDRLAASA